MRVVSESLDKVGREVARRFRAQRPPLTFRMLTASPTSHPLKNDCCPNKTGCPSGTTDRTLHVIISRIRKENHKYHRPLSVVEQKLQPTYLGVEALIVPTYNDELVIISLGDEHRTEFRV